MGLTVAYVTAFTVKAVLSGNLEFIYYAAVVLFFFVLVLAKYKKLGLGFDALIGLSIWGLLHMAGGNVPLGDGRLYELMVVPGYVKFDQFVHFFGFAVATIVGYQLLKPHLKPDASRITIAVLVVMIGTGAGALNEVVEFMAVLILPKTGVGDYFNNAWDLTYNLLGALAALVYLKFRNSKRPE